MRLWSNMPVQKISKGYKKVIINNIMAKQDTYLKLPFTDYHEDLIYF